MLDRVSLCIEDEDESTHTPSNSYTRELLRSIRFAAKMPLYVFILSNVGCSFTTDRLPVGSLIAINQSIVSRRQDLMLFNLDELHRLEDSP